MASVDDVRSERQLGDAAMRQRRFGTAAKHYKKAARLAGARPRTRHAMMNKRIYALRKQRAQVALRWAKSIRRFDAKVQSHIRRPKLRGARRERALVQLVEAAAAFRRDGDPQRGLWARSAAAFVLVRSGEDEQGKLLAEKLLPNAKDDYVRRLALEAARRGCIGLREPICEARHAIAVNAIDTARLKPAVRRYRRSRSLRRACRRYEKEAGVGQCAILAHSVTGEYVFDDPSRRRMRSLTPAAISAAQPQFLPLLKACLSEASKNPENADLFEDGDLQIEWVITPRGRAVNPVISPRRYGPVIGDCVAERLQWFRYPRFSDGQRHTVSVPYALSATASH